jgi:hypothetical protein
MLESVPSSVVIAIYLYFAVVAMLGLTLHWRLWRADQVTTGVGADADAPRTDVEHPVE